jgi:transposase InsO family protein
VCPASEGAVVGEHVPDGFGVEPICRALDVPVSTYYARRSRKPSRRDREDRELVRELYAAREGYRSVYGVRKTWKELRRRGIDVGRDRVARLMRQEGLAGVRRGTKRRTTIANEQAAEGARDLLERDFTASAPNVTWVCDITYLRTWQGSCYLAFILDCFSRMLVGWQLATHLRSDLVLDALEMANGLQRPGEGLIAHSDGGSSTRASPTPTGSTSSGSHPRRLTGRRLRQRDGRSLGGDLQDRARRRAPLPVLRTRRERGPTLDRLLQRGAAARRAR